MSTTISTAEGLDPREQNETEETVNLNTPQTEDTVYEETEEEEKEPDETVEDDDM